MAFLENVSYSVSTHLLKILKFIQLVRKQNIYTGKLKNTLIYSKKTLAIIYNFEVHK